MIELLVMFYVDEDLKAQLLMANKTIDELTREGTSLYGIVGLSICC